MSANICNICGANLIYKDGKWVCPACGAYKTEEISNEEVTLLYNAAQKLRLASFDDAEEAYRDIIAKYPENSEAHWGLVLSKYGIKYEDDYDGKKLPTCYATSIESVLTDKDYLDAVRLCKDKYQKEYYIEQGKVLEKIRVEWLEKASKEPKYDVFLCFKDSDKLNNMERTDDSIEVANLYTHLSSLGYKVFYSRESLRDKVAEKYEPYIYNALNTAAVMIVYGSKIEYFSSVWMKNEWTRYVRRLREGLKIEGSLVIACDGVNPGDLPRPLNQMQVLDARKKTFYGDLEAHIAKIISIARRPKATVERVEISSAIGKKKASIDNQIKTIKVGGGVGKKTPVVIDNAVSVREIGRYEVPALTPDEDTKLKSIAQFLRSGLFDPANKVADEILTKNRYNGQALLAKLLVEYSAKNIDELSEKINDINDFSIIHSVIEYNDKEIGEKIIGIICNKIKIAVQNGDFNKAESYFKEIAEYNSSNVTASRTTLRNKATELIKTIPDESDKIFALLLSTYSDADTYVSYFHGMVDDCLKVKNVALAKKYNNKILELDDGDVAATFNAVYLSVSACNIKEFVELIDLYADFSQLDDAIKHFGDYELSVCFYTLQQIFFGALQLGKSGETLSKWFDFIVKYEFDTRKDFIEKTLNELTDVKSLRSKAKLFDHVINCIDGSDVDRHIELRLSLADKLRIGGEFSLAEKYYNEVIDIEEGNCNALWGILLCKLNANRESDISVNIDSFTYFKELEAVLKYCPDEKTRVDYLDKLSAAVIMKSANLTVKSNVEKLSKVFDGIIKYYPEEFNNSLISYIQKFADNCKNSSAFSLAEKYYAMVLSIDNMQHSSYWGLLQAKLNCRNNDDLIKQNKIITEFTEFSSAIAASGGDERSSERYCQIAKNQLDYIEKQNTVAKQKKKRKSFIKKLTAAVAVMVAIVIGVFAFVGYRKSESVLKFSSNSTGVSVFAGKYYNSPIVEIPALNGDRQVTEIADNAFSGKNNITKVVLPSTITKIGNNAFSGATALESINIPDGVTYIGSSAFNGCKNLKTITIPEKTVEIGSAAFSGCENLTEITIVAREGDINDFAEDWKAGLPSFTKIKMGFVINLDYNGATSGVDTNKPVVGVNENYTLPSPVRNGYKFLGWYDSLENGNRLTDESGKSVSVYQKEQSITAYARWEANLNSIIFDANGGNGTMQNQQIATDSSAILSECSFTKIGYTFIGWGTTATQKTYDDKAEYAMGANSTYRLYAIWQANVNTLRFDANGGNGTMSDMNIKTEETKALAACGFSRKGYDFAGWATSENGTKAYSDKANYLMGPALEYTLFALWTPTKYLITYNLNGGSVSNANKTEYTIESTSFTLNNPIKNGYTFIGWSGTNLSEKTNTVTVNVGSTGNLVFTANWEIIVYKISYNLNGGSSSNTLPSTYTVEDNITLPVPTKHGYTFIKWADNGYIPKGTTGDKTFTANWSPIKYIITYNLNGGSVSSANKTEYTIESETFTLTNPTKPGYTFIGWSGTNIPDNTNAVTVNAGSIENLVFTANWEIIVYKISYNLNGGSSSTNLPSTYTVEDNITLPIPVKHGYTFTKWADNGYIPKGTTGDKKFIANWEPIKYTIKYNLNGGNVSSANKTEYTIESETFTLTNPVRPGYTFNGWTGSVLSDKTYTVSISTGSTGNLSFTANYDANLNSLLFNANGGVGETPEMLIETDKTVKLNTCAFNRKGYDFVGWATSQNGEKVYSDGQNYTMGVNSEYVLYAVWKIKTYTIEYNLNNGTAPSNKQSYTVETESFTLENPLRNGYTFIGWSGTDIADKSTAVTIEKGSIGNKSFTANWQANTNVLHFNSNGGDGDMDDMSIKTDETKTLSANTFTRKGYKFKGWSNTTNGAVAYLDLSSYKMGTAPVYTLYAVWEANTNRLIFNGNGATSGGMDEMSIKTDESTSLTDCGFAKIGYSFKGWATEIDGNVKYTNKATYTMGTESSYTLYAVWQINQYTITLELNGGTASKNSITQDYNTIVEPLETTRSGYDFVEWYADSDFATVYNFSTMPAENITVYAKWQLDTTYTGEIGIRNIQELQAINKHLSGKFYLENDINADGFSFTPIGNADNAFTGEFDGNGKRIRKLSILVETKSMGYVGLFGKSNGKIYNTHILDSFYQMPNAVNGFVGGICGYSDGTFYNCSWSGKIVVTGGSCGGIVGSGHATILQCFAGGEIITNYTISGTGGIAGFATNIENCYVDINIHNAKSYGTAGAQTNYIGGLITSEAKSVINCFVTQETSCYLTWYPTNSDYNWDRREVVTKLCKSYKGTITNSFRISKVSGDNVISPEDIKSRAIMTSKYGWSTDIWCFGYDYPVLYGTDYVKINYNGVAGLNNDNNPDGYKKNSDGFVLSNVVKDGYTFDGWYSDSDYKTKVEKVVNITEPLTLYAKWTPNHYTVTLNTVGGEVSNNTATVTYDSDYTLEVPTRLGYTFLGWYDGTGNSAVAYTDETGKSLGKWNLADGKTLYAKWQEI